MGKGRARDGHDQHGNPDKVENSKKYKCQTCNGTGSVGDYTCGKCNGTGEIG